MAQQIQALLPVLILLAAGVTAIVASQRLRLSPVVGFLLIGMLLGEGGFGLIQENDTTHLLAELGVVLLLFDIGLHFSIRRLWEVRRDIFGLGPVQILLCGAAFIGGLLAMGVRPMVSVLAGLALALSSTAVVSQVIAERRMERSPVTRSALAVLVVQDIAAIALLIMLAAIGGGDAHGTHGAEHAAHHVGQAVEHAKPAAVGLGTLAGMMLSALGKAAAAFAATLLLRQYAVAPVFNLVARSRSNEAISGAALLLVLGAAAVTGWLGLSLTLGAFLAGMMLADTPSQHRTQAETAPFRGLLLGFFFLSIGMALDPYQLITDAHWILLLLVVCLAVKLALVFAAARLVRTPTPCSIRLAFLLAQGGEFAFIVLNAPTVADGLGGTLHGALIASIAVSLAVTPWLTGRGCKLASAVARSQAARDPAGRPDRSAPDDQAAASIDKPLALLRLTPVGRRVANALSVHGIPYVVVEDDFDRFARGLSEGFPIVFGDVTNLHFAEQLDMDERPMVVATEFDLERAEAAAPVVQSNFPHLQRLAAVADAGQASAYASLGGVGVVQHSPLPGVDLAAEVLRRNHVPDRAIARWVATQQLTAHTDAIEAAGPALV